eukprot:scaffold6427_cov78-Cylindrotheca_fusiformis.AAC.1
MSTSSDYINNDNPNKHYCYPNAKFTLFNIDEILKFQLQQELAQSENYRLSSLGPPQKKQRIRGKLSPILIAKLQVKLGTPKTKMIRALCDSGASTTIMDKKFAKKLRIRKDNNTVWNTAGGTLTTTEKAKIRFQLPQLSTTMTVATDVHLTNGISDRYDIIIGRDLMRELGLKLNFNDD